MNTKCHLEILGLALLFCGAAFGTNYPLKISSTNPRILVDQNNVPFLMVGDSPHSLIVNLSSSDAAAYLADRAAHGFNSLWVELLCVGYTGGRADGSLLDGTKPFTKTLPGTTSYDLTAPNEAYFAHVDQVIRMAATNGIVVLLDPIETGGMAEDGARQRFSPVPGLWAVSGEPLQGLSQHHLAERKRLSEVERGDQ